MPTVGILGVSGVVGRQMLKLILQDPDFELVALFGNESIGKKVSLLIEHPEEFLTPNETNLKVKSISDKSSIEKCDVLLSALPSTVARPIEEKLANTGAIVVSNAASHRMDSDIPLLIPNVNPDHLQLIKYQKTLRKWKGIIVTSPNCTATILTVAIAPIYRNFGISQLYVSSMQAISGAGYPGVPSLDIMGNIIPYIEKEEEKVQTEPLKILGTPHNSGIKQASFSIQATCNRVPVHHGHTISVFIELPTRVAITEIKKTLITSFSTEKNGFRLISLSEEPDRPQPLKDVMKGNGMTVTIGRLRETQKGLSFTCLGHNLILGAAGAAIANAKRVIQYLNR